MIKSAIVGAMGLIMASSTGVTHVAPSFLYPNPVFTTGMAKTLDSKAVGHIKSSPELITNYQIHQVSSEYGYATSTKINHLYPVCAGGSEYIQNLWQIPKHIMWNGQDWGYQTKNKLDLYVCKEISEGKIDPKDAFIEITNDWVAYYNKLGIR